MIIIVIIFDNIFLTAEWQFWEVKYIDTDMAGGTCGLKSTQIPAKHTFFMSFSLVIQFVYLTAKIFHLLIKTFLPYVNFNKVPPAWLIFCLHLLLSIGGIMACCKMWYELPGCFIFPQPINKLIKGVSFWRDYGAASVGEDTKLT